MSVHSEPSTATSQNKFDAIENEEMRRRLEEGGKEVVLTPGRDREFPNTAVEDGPLYIDAEERIPELRERPRSPTSNNTSGDGELFLSDSEENSFERRDFMRYFSATAMLSTTAVAASCVRRPEEKVIPYADQPVDFVPGNSVYYATTCNECPANCGMIVNTREGRPVKVEGQPKNGISLGGLCGLGQSTLQELYHPERPTGAFIRKGTRKESLSWDDAFARIAEEMGSSSKIGILSKGATGNQTKFFKMALKNWGSPEDNLFRIESNPLYDLIATAHEKAFGEYSIPRLNLPKAKTVVSVGSDFLGAGFSPVFHAKNFSKYLGFNESTGERGKLIQFESNLTITGGKADKRMVIPPQSEFEVLLVLAAHLRKSANVKAPVNILQRVDTLLQRFNNEIAGAYSKLALSQGEIESVAQSMLAEQSVVIAGNTSPDANGLNIQLAAIAVNQLIGAYEETLLFKKGWMVAPTGPGDQARFLEKASDLDVLFVVDCNPAFTFPESSGIKDKLKNIKTVISIQSFPNETDEYARFSLTNHHFLEAWGDAQPVAGYWTLMQPVVRPMKDSRQSEDIILWISAHRHALGNAKPLPYKSYHNYLQGHWKVLQSIYGGSTQYDFFEQALKRNGGLGKEESRNVSAMRDITGFIDYSALSLSEGSLALSAPLDIRLYDGRASVRPISQETQDPLTTVVWDSFLLISPETSRRMGIKRNDLVKVSAEGKSLEVAVYPMPGMHPSSAVIARGNGRNLGISKVSDRIGVDPLSIFSDAKVNGTGNFATGSLPITIEKTGKTYRLAATQKHNDIANRTDIVRNIEYSKAVKDRKKTKDLDNVPDLYPKLEEGDFRWGMTIDLDKCTGCNACQVACSTENNVPQVGRKQILLGREMYWIRIDRYFSGPVGNPETTFQPVNCQQCNHAPCEAVCPVYATTHDPEGINAMTYNRCVGTRYCANACPYKVRRFNWFTHKWNVIEDKPINRQVRAMNPDVTVRTKGVMEKCNFCYQRVRTAKHAAKKAGNPGRVMVQTACQQTCPSDAIVFGDLKNNYSEAAKARRNNRTYLMLGGHPELEEYGIKTLPNVSYQAKVIPDKKMSDTSHHDNGEHSSPG